MEIPKTEQEAIEIINEYEKDNPHICGTDTLATFLVWFSKRLCNEGKILGGEE